MSEISPRQQQILRLVAAGQSNKEIASRLGVSARTVETHLRRLYSRWAVNNRAAVVAKWMSGDHESPLDPTRPDGPGEHTRSPAPIDEH